ncbi:hypothetical protein ACHAPO_010868 [Fusarium lateritium]
MDFTSDDVLISDMFTIRCGTVTLYKREKVLVISKPTLMASLDGNLYPIVAYFLPEDCKEIDESLEDAAIRGTFEKTGVEGVLLPAHIVTTATIPTAHEDSPSDRVTEPVAVSHRHQGEMLNIIFWYIAEATTSTIPQVVRKRGEVAKCFPVWLDFAQARRFLTWPNEWRIVDEAVSAVERGHSFDNQVAQAAQAAELARIAQAALDLLAEEDARREQAMHTE